ncbi:MAG: FUSC family protein [Gammaproteobacteria bacterium]
MSGLSQVPKTDIVHRAIASGPAKPKWWPVLVHSTRTAVAAVASVLAARLFGLPETYWAAITTLVITQSSLGTAVTVSGERFIGTALGAAVGAIVASYFGPGMLVFGISVFILGILSAAVHSDRSAYRLAGVTLAIVLLVPRTGPAIQIALHRFSEVCIGIGVALILTVVWPEKEETSTNKNRTW